MTSGAWLKISPKMLSEGVRVLSDQFGVVGEYGASEIAEEVFKAMARAGGLSPKFTKGRINMPEIALKIQQAYIGKLLGKSRAYVKRGDLDKASQFDVDVLDAIYATLKMIDSEVNPQEPGKDGGS